MPKLTLLNMSGEQIGDVDLKSEVFEAGINVPLMHQMVVAENANARQGTADTKTRDEVRGGGRKPFRQKGTGRARQGSIRASIQVGGGVAFGPHPRLYKKGTPKKMRRAAVRGAITARVLDGDVIIVDEIKMDVISTKIMATFLSTVGATGKTLLVLDGVTEGITKSCRNIPALETRISPAISVRDILDAEKIVMTKGAIAKLEEVLA